MISEEKFIELMDQNELNYFKVETDLDELEGMTLSLFNADINELLRFIKLNNINSVFYTYFYYDEYQYKLNPSEVSACIDSEVYSKIEEEIIEYNKSTELIDFSRPLSAYIFVIYQGRYITIHDVDLWLNELDIVPAEEKIATLLEKCENIIIDIKDNLIEEFKQCLINDDEFKVCTNQLMRIEYIDTLIRKKDYKKYQRIFITNKRIGKPDIDKSKIFTFSEKVWKEYKSQKKC